MNFNTLTGSGSTLSFIHTDIDTDKKISEEVFDYSYVCYLIWKSHTHTHTHTQHTLTIIPLSTYLHKCVQCEIVEHYRLQGATVADMQIVQRAESCRLSQDTGGNFPLLRQPCILLRDVECHWSKQLWLHDGPFKRCNLVFFAETAKVIQVLHKLYQLPHADFCVVDKVIGIAIVLWMAKIYIWQGSHSGFIAFSNVLQMISFLVRQLSVQLWVSWETLWCDLLKEFFWVG